MPKIVDKEQMIKSIMKAAQSAFVKYGFHKTTMDKIAKEAHIAKGTLYLYFDSKEDLSQKLIVTQFETSYKNLTRKNQFETLDALLAHIEKGLVVSKQESQFISIIFESFGPSFASNHFTVEMAKFFDQIGEFYSSNLQMLIDKGKINNSIDAVVLGRALVSLMDGLILHKSLFKLSANQYKSMIKEVIDLFRRGLKK